jgi:hypothetical protein
MNDWRGLQTALAADNDWQGAYAYVEESVRERLSDPDTVARLHLEQDTLSTNQIVELMWPERFAKGDGITARKRLYKALKALATRGLADCCERGPQVEVVIAGVKRFARPWRWHAPKPPAYATGPFPADDMVNPPPIGATLSFDNGTKWERVA